MGWGALLSNVMAGATRFLLPLTIWVALGGAALYVVSTIKENGRLETVAANLQETVKTNNKLILTQQVVAAEDAKQAEEDRKEIERLKQQRTEANTILQKAVNTCFTGTEAEEYLKLWRR